jgi:diacylglycerol kinase (ATP)
MKTDRYSFKSRADSFRFAFNGLASMFKTQHNARIHLVAGVIAITMGIILKIHQNEWCLLIIVIGLVFLTELLNTSLEALSDIVESEWNEKIMKAKDYAAAAVLISAIISVAIGAFIFIPKIVSFF